ncbi:hypothetical protein CBR_g34385 [Chara braunii]|uniref:Uncharacterized protein n=1 Tax=Chara braunii TaxID=69332 RepID=A0A388LIN4_CHABU|nr:hypothetical protein CBR_g34385 [Chara braunii]|eukprot:GBG82105.1 hypothetical protein CBR_g34385 [Chara braunii]
MEFGGDDGRAKLTTIEKMAVVAAMMTALFHCRQDRALGRIRVQIRARRRTTAQGAPVDGLDTVAGTEAVLHVCCAMGCGVLPRLRWWMKRKTGGVWEDLRQCDDATEGYFREKLHMSPRVFWEVTEALSPHLQRSVMFYGKTLQPDHIIAYPLYRWALGQTYESSTCNFGIGRASGLVATRDVAAALMAWSLAKIS